MVRCGGVGRKADDAPRRRSSALGWAFGPFARWQRLCAGQRGLACCLRCLASRRGPARAQCSGRATSLSPRASGLWNAVWARPMVPLLGPSAMLIAAALLA